MDFSRELDEKLKRYKEFYDNPQPGQLLITIPPYTFETPKRPGSVVRTLKDWEPFKDAEIMAEEEVSNARFFNEYTSDVGCDYIPSVSPAYGIGLCSAFLSNAEVIPGVDTSWVHAVMDNLYDYSCLKYEANNPWVDFMERFMKRARELWNGDYCVAIFGTMAPSDLSNALRGNELFYDLYDDPDGVKQLLSVCVDATEKLYRTLYPLTIAPEGGFTAGGLWLPGEGLYLSEDGADLCSGELYRELFMPATQELINRIGGAYIHHHAKGWQIHPLISQLKGLHFLEFSWDPNCPRPIDHLDELLELSLTTPLQTRCTLDDLRKYLPQMRQGRMAIMVNVDSLDDAREAVRLVRKYSVI